MCSAFSTWGGTTPTVCIYEVDFDTFLPVERSTYGFNMTEANEGKNISL